MSLIKAAPIFRRFGDVVDVGKVVQGERGRGGIGGAGGAQATRGTRPGMGYDRFRIAGVARARDSLVRQILVNGFVQSYYHR
jgi:hypothetical protein